MQNERVYMVPRKEESAYMSPRSTPAQQSSTQCLEYRFPISAASEDNNIGIYMTPKPAIPKLANARQLLEDKCEKIEQEKPKSNKEMYAIVQKQRLGQSECKKRIPSNSIIPIEMQITKESPYVEVSCEHLLRQYLIP